ncbi:hypothetical protein [Orientia tsutsugamushi]|nr:hypothetical protein [Orientia tsutsugamushi]
MNHLFKQNAIQELVKYNKRQFRIRGIREGIIQKVYKERMLS